MRVPAVLLVSLFTLASLTTLASAEPIGGNHNRDDIRKTCSDNGGSFWSNLDAYGCTRVCTDKGEQCAVTCNNDGSCEGFTPPASITVGGARITVEDFLNAVQATPPRQLGPANITPNVNAVITPNGNAVPAAR